MHCKFSRDFNSEKILKIGQYLTKVICRALQKSFCTLHTVFTFLVYKLNVFGVYFFGIGLSCIGLDVVDADRRGI